MSKISIKRIYEPAEASDGYRVLVDRLWPRGLKRDSVAIDRWAKELAPSTELRKWVHSQPEKWPEFEVKYLQELQGAEMADLLKEIRRQEITTLLYGARDEKQNHAQVLQSFLLEKLQADS
ncbi:MAG TPA: DUF488 family protein [Sphingobacteriaceae bacterium]